MTMWVLIFWLSSRNGNGFSIQEIPNFSSAECEVAGQRIISNARSTTWAAGDGYVCVEKLK